MSITKELNKPIPGNQVLGLVGIAFFFIWVAYIQSGSQEIRGNIRSEQACLDAAKARADVDGCVKLIHKNMGRE